MSDPRVDILILAAHPLELAPFARVLGPSLRAELGGHRVAACAVGVGLSCAGAGAAAALGNAQPKAALLVGSYGAYPASADFEPGTLLVPARVCLIDEAVLAGRAAIPAAMPVTLDPDPALCAALCALHPAQCAPLATTVGVTTDDAHARWLGERSGCVGENLEALVIGLACARYAVRFAAVLACTNRVGATGRSQWQQHNRMAAEASARAVLAWLTAGAPPA